MGDFDDINVKINVDASGAEQGLTRVSTSLNKLNSDVDKLGSGANFGDKLNSESKQAEGGLDKLGEAAEQANQKLAKVGSGLNLSAVGSQLDALSGKMQAWGAGLSILAAPFELVGAASVNAFADFEAGMGKIFTLLPDITEKGMSEMSAQIKEFSTTFGADLSTVQQAAYDALSSGVSQADLMPFLETAQTAAVAGMSDVGTAVDGLTSAINAYQMELDDAGRVSDVFFKTVELGKIEFDELSRYIGKVAPTAAQFGISIEDTGAAIAAMTSQGVSAEETMTGLKNLFKDVATPGTRLNKIFQKIAGVTFKDFIANGGTLAEAISKLRDYSNQTGKSFFEMGSTFDSANTLAMLGGGFFENYAEMTEEIGSAAGSTESAYGKMSDTMAFALDKLKAQFQVMSVDIGKKLAPVVLDFTQWLTENADQISDFAQSAASAAVPAIESIFDTLQRGMDMYENMSPETKAMLAKLIGVGAVGAAVGGPAMMGTGLMLSPIGQLVTALGQYKTNALLAAAAAGKLAPATGSIGTEAAAASGMLSGLVTSLGGLSTIAPIVIGTAGVVAGAFVAYQTNFADFRTNVDNAIEHVNNAANLIDRGQYQQAGRELANAVGDGFATAKDLIVKGIPDAAVFAYELDSQMRVAIGDMSGGFGAALREMVDGALASAGAAFEQFAINDAAFAKSFSESLRNGDWAGAAADAAGKFKDSFYTNGKIDAGKLLDGVDSLTSKLQPALDMITLISNPFGGAASVLGGESGNILDGYFNPEKYKKTSDEIEKFERAVAKSLQNAGTEVKTFADKSSADLNNAMSKWQDAFEKSGKSLEEWTESLKKSGDYSQFIADMDAFAAKYPELADKAGGAANVMKQLDFKPVQFEDGSIFYAYENGVLTPIVDNPIKIMMELNDYENDMRSAYEIYLDYKSQIENAPIMVQMMTSGDVNTSDTSAWKWVPDDPNSKDRNIPGETNTQNATQNGTEAAAPAIAEATGKSIAESLAKERGWNYKGSPDVAMAERFLAENPEFAEKYQAELKAAAEETTEETKKSGDKIVKSLEELKTEAYNKAQESFIDPTTDTKYQFNKDTGQYEKYTMVDKLAEEKAKADQKAIEAQQKASEKAIEARTKAEDTYNKKIQDAIHQMGKWDIQDKYDKRDIENDKPNMMDYDSIDAYNKALSSYSDKLDKLTNSRAEKEELLAYDLGITVEELRNLAAGHKNVTSSGEKLVSTFNTIANIDFSKLTNPFAPQQTGTGTPLSDAELTAIMRAKMPYASESDFAGIVSQQGGIKALAKSWGIIDESGRRIGEYTSETTDKLEKSSELLKSVSDIIGDDLSPGFDRATKYIEEFKKITGDDTDYSDENQKTLALLLNAYKDASDLQDKYEDVLSDSNYLLDEQRDITDKYNDILRLVGLTGIDTTQSLEGLPPAIRAIVEAIMALVNGVKVNSDTRTSGLETPDKNPNKSYIGEIDAESDALFKKIQQDFKNVQLAYDSGKLSQADYLKQLKELSVEADVLSHDPSALKGAQREAIQRFEETIQEQFRRDYAGTGAKGIKNYNPDASLKSAINDLNSQSYPIGKSIKETGTEAKPTTPQINTLNSAFEKIGLTGSGLTDVLSNVNQALSDHHANIQESQDYLKQYNEAAGENIKYTKDQEGQTKDLMNSLGMLGIAQNMYNTYMQEGILDSTESAHVQEALAAATKMMGDAGIDANTNLAGLPGALQALASAAQAAMSQISSAIAMANAQITNVRKVGDWTLQTMSGITPMAPSTPTNFKFASGGPVTENGPAYLHQGEYVLRRDEVNRLTSGGMTINLSINMSNSKFGNAEMAKTLPKRIASEMNKSLKRYGV